MQVIDHKDSWVHTRPTGLHMRLMAEKAQSNTTDHTSTSMYSSDLETNSTGPIDMVDWSSSLCRVEAQ